jgi:hypothetical protein
MKTNILSIFILLTALSLKVLACDLVISKVTVLDNNFKIVKIITSPNELAQIQNAWCSFKPINTPPNTNWSHTLDIVGGKLTGRWSYNSQGYISRLNYQLKPSYQLPNPGTINKLIVGL